MFVRTLWIRRLILAGGAALAALAMLLPWWRQHDRLRDFYDYGLVMAGVGRIAAGERPYRDFVTPIQSGTFLFNSWAERAGGDTYRAMTGGAAVLIVLSVVGLALMFARRWPTWVALLLATALTAMSAVQHTIIWHNALGALTLVVAVWAAAVAPVLRGRHWPWLLLAAAALFVGGINKLNAQLVALAGVSAWTLRAWVGGEADARRGFATLAVWVVAGVFAPVAFELAWTGAGFTSWWHNVVALPFSSRAGDFEWVFRPEFYLRIRHDYYGALSIPWLGALGLATTLGIGGVLWHNARGLGERGWVVGAGAFVAAAGAGLLATNYEIAWVAMAAWLGLLAAWWVGFGRPARGRGFHVLIVAPAVVVGAAAWESAWRGQRSQFGYSTAPRSSYVDAGTVHADFAYLRGTFVPPEIAQTMNEAQQARARILPLYRNRTFYGPGLEWLQRVWPTTKVRGLPLWMHVGTSYGPDEEARLHDAIRPGGVYELVVASQPRDHWPETIDAELRRDYRRAHFGPVWVMYRARPPGAVPFEARTFLREFGGNVDPAWLASTLGARALSDGRKFLGTTRGTGVLVLRAASYRLHLEAVIRRTAAARKGTVRLRFESFGVSGEQLLERGSFDAELPAGEAERVFPTSIDPGGLPMMFAVSIPDDLEGCVEAGWRGPRLTHTVDGDDTPPALVPGAAPATRADDGYVAALLPSAGPRPAVFTRGAGPAGPEGVTLPPGGEIWLRVQDGLAIDFVARTIGDLHPPALPVLHAIYYKGGRIEILRQDAIRSTEPVRFHAWSAEAGGWIGLALDPSDAVPALCVKVAASP